MAEAEDVERKGNILMIMIMLIMTKDIFYVGCKFPRFRTVSPVCDSDLEKLDLTKSIQKNIKPIQVT